MAFTKLEFTKDWRNPTDFPTVEDNETKVREDMQLLHEETKAALNGLIDDLEGEGGGAAANISAKDKDGNDSTVQAVLDDLFTKPVVVTTTTTFQEIADLYNDGNKLILLVYSGRVYRLVRLALTDATFAALASVTVGDEHTLCARTYWLSVNSSNVWDSWDNTLQNILTFDNTPTDGSTNPVTSDGIYDAIDAKSTFIARAGVTTGAEIKAALQANRPVVLINNLKLYTLATCSGNSSTFVNIYKSGFTITMGVISVNGSSWSSESQTTLLTSVDYNTLSGQIAAKQDTLTFDNTPTEDSTNPVTSDGVYNALTLKADLASPDFTGNPTAPTQTEGDNSTKIATTAYADRAVATETARATAAENAVALNAAPAIVSTASGAVASFPDGADDIPVKSLIAQIKAAQNLNGYSNPWPAGGGKNPMPCAVAGSGTVSNVNWTSDGKGKYTLTGTADSNGTLNVSFTDSFVFPDGASWYLCLMNSQALTGVSITFKNSGTNLDSWGLTSANRYSHYSALTGKTCDGFGINIVSGTTYNLTISPQAVQDVADVSTFYPYSNIRPISGYTGVNIPRTGANIWDEQWEAGTYDAAASTVIKTVSYNHIRSKNPISVKPNTTYYFESTGKNVHLIVADAAGNVLFRTITLNNGTFTTPDNGVFVYFNMAQAYGNTYGNDISINYPSSDTAYHAYVGEVFSVSWQDEAGTVYGGTVDLVTGVLTVTHARQDLGQLTWNYRSGYTDRFIASPPSLMPPSSNDAVTTAICDSYPAGSYNSVRYSVDKAFGVSIASNIIVSNSGYDNDLAGFQSAMNGVYLVYPLASATVYTLSGQEVASLLGQNNVWNDVGGDTEVEYVADTALALSEILPDAPAADGTYTLTCTVSGGVATYSWA